MIHKTTDYSIFKKHHSNRDLYDINLKKLISSIKAQNLLQFRPITVDSTMHVIDGQHRLEAAKVMGLEIYYQVSEDATHEHMVLLNANQRIWAKEDYLNYYISLGNLEYLKLKEFCEKHELALSEFFPMVSEGYRAGSDNFKRGGFKFVSADAEEELSNFLDKYKDINSTLCRYCIGIAKVTKSSKLRRAIFTILKVDDFDFDLFLKRLTLRSETIKPCANTYGYYVMLREIYNYRNPNPIE